MEQELEELRNQLLTLQQHNDDLTNWLASCCEILYESKKSFKSIGLEDWYLEYKQHSEYLESSIIEDIKRKELRKNALEKLTPEERKILNVTINPRYKTNE